MEALDLLQNNLLLMLGLCLIGLILLFFLFKIIQRMWRHHRLRQAKAKNLKDLQAWNDMVSLTRDKRSQQHKQASLSSNYIRVERAFNRCITVIKRKRLIRRAVPVYVVVGEPQSGKTTLLQSVPTLLQGVLNDVVECKPLNFNNNAISESESQNSNSNAAQSLSNTQEEQESLAAQYNKPLVNFYYSQKTIMIDVDGRSFLDRWLDSAGTEWNSILKLLFQRHRELNIAGLVISIPADALLADDTATTAKKAAFIAECLHDFTKAGLMRVPVYVVITKLDYVIGFSEFVAGLSVDEQRNVLGFVYSADEYTPEQVLEHFNAQLTALNQYLDEMLYDQFSQAVNGELQDSSDTIDAKNDEIADRSNLGKNNETNRFDGVADSYRSRAIAAYLFPKAIANLQSALMIYLNSLFSEHEYIEARYARFSGLFFTSAINGHICLNTEFAALQNKRIDEAPLYCRYPTRRGQSFFTHGLFEQVFFQSILRAQLSRRRILLDGMPYLIVTGLFSALALSFVGLALMQSSSFKNQMDSQTSFYAGISNLFSNDTLDTIPLISVDLNYNGYPAYNISMPGNSSISRLNYFYIIMTQLRDKIEVPYGFKSAALLQDKAQLNLGFNKRSFIANEIQTRMVFIPAVRSTEFALMYLRSKPITKASSVALKELLTMDAIPDLYKDSHYDSSRLQNLLNFLIPTADRSIRQLLGLYDPRYNYLAEFNRITILLSPERDRAIDSALNSLYQGYKNINNYPDSEYIRSRNAIIKGVELSRLYYQILRFGSQGENSDISSESLDVSAPKDNKDLLAANRDQFEALDSESLNTVAHVAAALPPSQGDAMINRSEERMYFYRICTNQILERIKFISDNSSAFASFLQLQPLNEVEGKNSTNHIVNNVTNSLINQNINKIGNKLDENTTAISEKLGNKVTDQLNTIIDKSTINILNRDPLSRAFDEYMAQFNADLDFIDFFIKERKKLKLSVDSGLKYDVFTRFALQRDNLSRAIYDQYRFISSERDLLKQDPLFKPIVQDGNVTNRHNFDILADLIKLTFFSQAGDEVTIDNFNTLLKAEKRRYERQLNSLEQYLQVYKDNDIVNTFGPVARSILDEQALLSQINIINSFLHLMPTSVGEFSSQIAMNFRIQNETQGREKKQISNLGKTEGNELYYSNMTGIGNVYNRIKNAQRTLGEINFAAEFDPQGALVFSNNLALLKDYLADQQNPLASKLNSYYQSVPRYPLIMQAMQNYLIAYTQYWGSFTDNIQLTAKSYAEFNHYVNSVRSYQINSSLLSLYNLSYAAVKNISDVLLDDIEKTQKDATLERLKDRELTFNQHFNDITGTFLNSWASLPNTALAANSYVTALSKRQLKNSLLLLTSNPNDRTNIPFYTHLVNLGTNLIKDEAFNIAHQNLAYYQAEFVHFPLVQDSEYNEEPLSIEQLVRFERLLKSLGLDRYAQSIKDDDSLSIDSNNNVDMMMDTMVSSYNGTNSESQRLELQMPILFKSSFVTDQEILDWANSCLQVIDLLVNRPKPITFSITIPPMREQEALLHSRGVSLPSALSRMRYINATSDEQSNQQRYYTFQDGKKDIKPSELLRTTLSDSNLKFKLYQFSDDKHAESEAQIDGSFAVLRAYFDPNSIYDNSTNSLIYPLFLKDSKGVSYCLFINFKFSEPLLPLEKWPTTYRWPKI